MNLSRNMSVIFCIIFMQNSTLYLYHLSDIFCISNYLSRKFLLQSFSLHVNSKNKHVSSYILLS